jgi:hypothetical protein
MSASFVFAPMARGIPKPHLVVGQRQNCVIYEHRSNEFGTSKTCAEIQWPGTTTRQSRAGHLQCRQLQSFPAVAPDSRGFRQEITHGGLAPDFPTPNPCNKTSKPDSVR